MMARFSPGMPLAKVSTGNKVRRLRDGRLVIEANLRLPPEYVEQYRQGYRCLRCHGGPQPEPFPEECFEPFCKFPIRERQMEVFERLYEGEVPPPPEAEGELEPLELTDEEWEQAKLDVVRSREFLWIPPEAEID